jgi:hypothetical protein
MLHRAHVSARGEREGKSMKGATRRRKQIPKNAPKALRSVGPTTYREGWASLALSSVQSRKGCHLNANLITIVVQKFGIWKALVPTLPILQGASSLHIFQYLVGPLGLTVGLQMVCWAKIELGVHRFMKLLPKFSRELGSSVRHDPLGDSMQTYYPGHV